jgi:hypothetical protein
MTRSELACLESALKLIDAALGRLHALIRHQAQKAVPNQETTGGDDHG